MSEFPGNIVQAIKDETQALLADQVDTVLKRPLRPTDPNRSIGIMALDWKPLDFQIGQHDPVLSQYQLAIQLFVKHQSEEEGLEQYTLLSKNLRLMLYRREPLRIRLSSLTETSFGVTERVQRWGIRQQRFVSNEVQGRFLFLSTTEFWVETEAV